MQACSLHSACGAITDVAGIEVGHFTDPRRPTGCSVVIALFVLFVYAGLRVSLRCPDRYGCLLGAGITSMIGLQALINMGVVTGMMPTTGLPLPFFSAGGTSVSMIMAAVGILLNISRTNGRAIVPRQAAQEKR